MTLDERLLRQMAPQQFGLFVLASLGAIALLLTVLGTMSLQKRRWHCDGFQGLGRIADLQGQAPGVPRPTRGRGRSR